VCVYLRQDIVPFLSFFFVVNYTAQQNLTFFVPRGKISNPDSNFNAEFKYVSSFSPSPTVFFGDSHVKCEKRVKKCVYLHISLDNKI
jgi:hypothetical protein